MREYIDNSAYCYRCNGTGKIRDLMAKWWQFWKLMTCPVCHGDGNARAPEGSMRRYRPPWVPKNKLEQTQMNQKIKRKKIIVIEDCLECIHLDDTTAMCSHPKKANEFIRIENIFEFPDWCPLEDAKIEVECSK